LKCLSKRGQDNDRLMAQPGQFARQAAAHVAEPAGLAKGHGFGGGKKDSQCVFPR
jgi:hypothetical protein